MWIYGTRDPMELQQISLSLPAMYGDHHVVKVRQLVTALPGITEVIASAERQRITVTFDPARLSTGEIASALEAGGYPPGQAAGGAVASPSADDHRHVLAADQAKFVPEPKYHPPPSFGVCPGVEQRAIAGEHPADRK